MYLLLIHTRTYTNKNTQPQTHSHTHKHSQTQTSGYVNQDTTSPDLGKTTPTAFVPPRAATLARASRCRDSEGRPRELYVASSLLPPSTSSSHAHARTRTNTNTHARTDGNTRTHARTVSRTHERTDTHTHKSIFDKTYTNEEKLREVWRSRTTAPFLHNSKTKDRRAEPGPPRLRHRLRHRRRRPQGPRAK